MHTLTDDQSYLKTLTILYLDDEELSHAMFSQFFTRVAGGLVSAKNGAEGLEAYRIHKPDIIVTDIQMPIMDGLSMSRAIRDIDRSVPIIVLTSFTDAGCLMKSINIGIDRYVTKPVDARELQEALLACAHRLMLEDELHRAKVAAEALSRADGLTGLANRRHFDEVLAREYARHIRSGLSLSLIMLDIDHFKKFNDTYGHLAGDDCLRQVARVIADSTYRINDLPARYGGEEFTCILPETDQHGALLTAERIRSGIIDLSIPNVGSTVSGYISASLGVLTGYCTLDATATDMIARADELLYKAKGNGRNRLECNDILQL